MLKYMLKYRSVSKRDMLKCRSVSKSPVSSTEAFKSAHSQQGCKLQGAISIALVLCFIHSRQVKALGVSGEQNKLRIIDPTLHS